MARRASTDQTTDPLEYRTAARAIVLLTLGAVILGLALSTTSSASADLPGVALGATWLLHLERALLTGAIAALLAIFAVRGWAGYFPSKISTTGAEYLVRSATSETVRTGDEAMAALEGLETRQLALADFLRDEIRRLERRLGERI